MAVTDYSDAVHPFRVGLQEPIQAQLCRRLFQTGDARIHDGMVCLTCAEFRAFLTVLEPAPSRRLLNSVGVPSTMASGVRTRAVVTPGVA